MTSDKPTQAEMERAARQRDDDRSSIVVGAADFAVISDYIGIMRYRPIDVTNVKETSSIIAKNAIRKMRLA